MHRKMLLLVGFTAACAERMTEVERMSGDYSLVAVNGPPLPAEVEDEAGPVDGVEWFVDSASISLSRSGTWNLDPYIPCTVGGEQADYCTTPPSRRRCLRRCGFTSSRRVRRAQKSPAIPGPHPP